MGKSFSVFLMLGVLIGLALGYLLGYQNTQEIARRAVHEADGWRIKAEERQQTIRMLDAEMERLHELLREFFPNFNMRQLRSTTVTASSYNPVEEQCDSTPLIASDNKLVEPGILALPQHYRKELGIRLGQRVVLEGLGVFTVRDHMHNRKPRGRVDIISFIPEWSTAWGKRPLKMYWIAGG